MVISQYAKNITRYVTTKSDNSTTQCELEKTFNLCLIYDDFFE